MRHRPYLPPDRSHPAVVGAVRQQRSKNTVRGRAPGIHAPPLHARSRHAEPRERTTLVISEARCTPARVKRRLIALGASGCGRRVGPRVAEGSEAGLLAGDRGQGVQPGRAVSPSPRDRGPMRPAWWALHEKPVGDKDGAIYGAGAKSLALVQKRGATPSTSTRRGPDMLSSDKDQFLHQCDRYHETRTNRPTAWSS